jgi:hypothetical protein
MATETSNGLGRVSGALRSLERTLTTKVFRDLTTEMGRVRVVAKLDSGQTSTTSGDNRLHPIVTWNPTGSALMAGLGHNVGDLFGVPLLARDRRLLNRLTEGALGAILGQNLQIGHLGPLLRAFLDRLLARGLKLDEGLALGTW